MVPAVETARDRGEAANFFLPGKFWDTTYWIILGRGGGMGWWDGMKFTMGKSMGKLLENYWNIHGDFIGKTIIFSYEKHGKTIELLVIEWENN